MDTVVKYLKPEKKIYPHQKDAIQWMVNQNNGILSMPPGAGKTLIVYIHSLIIGGTSLYICKNATQLNDAVLQIKQFFNKGSFKYLVFHENFHTKKYLESLTNQDLKEYDMVLTTPEKCMKSNKLCIKSGKESVGGNSICIATEAGLRKGKIDVYSHQRKKKMYKSLKKGYTLLHNFLWKSVYIDEGHNITKCGKPKFRSVASIPAEQRFVMSGTLVRNGDKDAWAVLFLAGYDEVTHQSKWRYYHFTPKVQQLILKIDNIEHILAQQLPPLVMHDLKIFFSEDEQKIYDYYFSCLWSDYKAFIDAPSADTNRKIISQLTLLSQLCIMPHSLSKKHFSLEDKLDDESKRLTQLIKDEEAMGFRSSKMREILNLLEQFIDGKDDEGNHNQVVVFSHYSSLFPVMVKYLYEVYSDAADIYRIIDGKTPQIKRNKSIKDFQKGYIKVLFANYTILGEGINLQKGNKVIFVESTWNFDIQVQAMKRLHRMGQTRQVDVYRFLMKGSLEEQIHRMCQAKQSIGQSYITGDGSQRQRIPGMTGRELGPLLLAAMEERKKIYDDEWYIPPILNKLFSDNDTFFSLIPKDIKTCIAPFIKNYTQSYF